MRQDGRRLSSARITNSPAELRKQIARAGKNPKVVLEATYAWHWAADTLAAAGAEVHLARLHEILSLVRLGPTFGAPVLGEFAFVHAQDFNRFPLYDVASVL